MAEVRDGTLKISIASGNETILDEIMYSITEYSRGIKIEALDIAASASDANVELTNFGFKGVLVLYDPNNTGEVSVKLASAANVARQINPIHVISGSDVDGLVDLYFTNSDTSNANEIRMYWLLDAST